MTYDTMGLTDFWEESAADLDDSRPALATLAVRPSDFSDDTVIEVVLVWEGRWSTGRAVTRSSDDVAEAAAQAAVESIGGFLPHGWRATLDLLDVRQLSTSRAPVTIANVVVSCTGDDGTETYVGAALVRSDPRVAAVRATLAAMNRRLWRLRNEA